MFWNKKEKPDDSQKEDSKSVDDGGKTDKFYDKVYPYLQKAILAAAVASANEKFSNDESLKFIYERLIRLLPGPISFFFPDKWLFDLLCSKKEELVRELEAYKAKVDAEAIEGEPAEVLHELEYKKDS